MHRPILDHIDIAVRDLRVSGAFYRAALAPLGIVLLREGPHDLTFGRPGPDDFGLNDRRRPSVGLHLAFAARSRDEVEAFHAAAVAAGGRCNGPPGVRAEYHAAYYAAFVSDPDGHNIEAVFHDRP